jgi:hypothetical protein
VFKGVLGIWNQVCYVIVAPFRSWNAKRPSTLPGRFPAISLVCLERETPVDYGSCLIVQDPVIVADPSHLRPTALERNLPVDYGSYLIIRDVVVVAGPSRVRPTARATRVRGGIRVSSRRLSPTEVERREQRGKVALGLEQGTDIRCGAFFTVL